MKLILFLLSTQENTNNATSMIPSYFALIAAGIGAITALTTQFLSSKLTSWRERKKLKMELVAEERCLAYLLSEYYRVLIGEVTLSAYYLRLSKISFSVDGKADNSMFHTAGNEAIEKAQNIEEKIRITTANYFKVITLFTNITGKKENIINLFNSIKDFEKPKFSTFNEYNDFSELTKAKEIEEDRLIEVYRNYPKTFNKISEEMNKLL